MIYSILSQDVTTWVRHVIINYFKIWNKNFAFSSFKSREKDEKVTLVTFKGLGSLKGQFLDDIFKFKESEKIEMTIQVALGKKEYQVTMNCNIHLSK